MKIDQQLLDIEGIRTSKVPLLDLFIRRTAVLTSTPEHIVEKIVKDQWQQANKKTQPNDPVSEIDFCNLGTFFISKSKAEKRLRRLEKYNAGILEKGENSTKNSNEVVLQRNSDMIKSIMIKTKNQLKLYGSERKTYIGGD